MQIPKRINTGVFLSCVVVGDIFYDILLRVRGNSLRYNLGGTCYASNIHMFAGGSGNITATLALLGMNSILVGKAGKDCLGKLYVDDLKAQSVTTLVSFDKQCPTGINITLLHPDGQRSFIVSRGANDNLCASEIEASRNFIRDSFCVYVSGYSLVRCPQRHAIVRAAEIAKEYGKLVVFDPGASNLIQTEREVFYRLLRHTDVLCPNAQEAVALAETPDLRKAIERLNELVPLVIVKVGSKGAITSNRDQGMLSIPGRRAKCIDTTGAGDVFAAGIIFGFYRRMPLKDAVSFANWLASKKIPNLGPRSLPSRKQIYFFLRKTMGCASSPEVEK